MAHEISAHQTLSGYTVTCNGVTVHNVPDNWFTVFAVNPLGETLYIGRALPDTLHRLCSGNTNCEYIIYKY